MSTRYRSQQGFVGVTLITVLGIALILVVYATLLGTIPGGKVTVGGVDGSVSYSLTNPNTLPGWNSTLYVPDTSTSWYAKMNTTAGGYIGPAKITWQLERSTDGGTNYTPVPGASTFFTTDLDGTEKNFFATDDGTWKATNRDWHFDATSAATYCVVVTIETNP